MEKKTIPITFGNEKLHILFEEIIEYYNNFGNYKFQIINEEALQNYDKKILITDDEFLINQESLILAFGLIFVYNDNLNIRFTEKESQIFMCLLDNSNTQISKKNLLKKVWSYNEDIDTHTLETHIYSLRKKIEKNLKLKDLIIFLDNKGYFLNKKIL